MTEWIEETLQALHEGGLYRNLNIIDSPQSSRVILDGKEIILLSSNNYLGLTTHPHVIESSIQATRQYGTGAGGSRLVTGTMRLHRTLEERIAQFKGTQDAIVFGTGYMANVGVLTSVVEKGDLILSDSLNHASIIDGCRLSRADVAVYRHCDMDDLATQLEQSHHRRKLIVTDGVFSMDGDIAPLPDIVKLAKKHDAMVMVDDAHGTGVLGRGGSGKGTCDHFGVDVDIRMGTLSKALASQGGFVTGSLELVEFLRNKAKPFIYSTAPPPSSMGAAIGALDVIESESDNPVQRLWENISYYKKGLVGLGYDITSTTQIIPIMIGDTKTTMEVSQYLMDNGIYAPGIRPPTVAEGTGRIRTSIMATHTKEDLDEVLCVMDSVRHKFSGIME